MEERICEVCHKPYAIIRGTQKYCSHDCRRVRQRERARDPELIEKRKIYMRIYGPAYNQSEGGKNALRRKSCRRIIEYCRKAGLSPATTNAMVLDGNTLDIRMQEIGYKSGVTK